MSRRISEYQILSTIRGEDDLVSQVNKSISAGWEPIGGVVVHPSGSSFILLQAMVKITEAL